MGAETFAGFGQLDWKITSAWKATLGIRYSYDAKWGDDAAQLYEFLPIYDINAPIAIPFYNASLPAQKGATATHYDATTGLWVRKLSGDWSGTTGVAGVQWEPDRDTNVYAKYSRGYKSGGFNAGSNLSPGVETDPETLNDYQFGFKKNFGRQFQFNLDLFYDQYYNAQIPVGEISGGVVTSPFVNIPEARSDGVEIETVWAPTHALQFMLDYGYDDTAIIKSGCLVDVNDLTATKAGATPGGCTGGAQNLKGDELPNAPKNKLAINGLYTWELPAGALSFSTSVIWRDVQYGSIFQRPQYEAPSWDQVDLRAEFKPNGGHWTLIAYGKNIFNTTGYSAGAAAVSQTNGTFIKQFVLNPPAIGGVEVQYKF
jgi:iron complex outermembrane receptor protein